MNFYKIISTSIDCIIESPLNQASTIIAIIDSIIEHGLTTIIDSYDKLHIFIELDLARNRAITVTLYYEGIGWEIYIGIHEFVPVCYT